MRGSMSAHFLCSDRLWSGRLWFLWFVECWHYSRG
jgi:Penicillin tolerance protein